MPSSRNTTSAPPAPHSSAAVNTRAGRLAPRRVSDFEPRMGRTGMPAWAKAATTALSPGRTGRSAGSRRTPVAGLGEDVTRPATPVGIGRETGPDVTHDAATSTKPHTTTTRTLTPSHTAGGPKEFPRTLAQPNLKARSVRS